ncbi:MAG: GGDEF domain-containing protein [Alphaproteobacteria bacterium]
MSNNAQTSGIDLLKASDAEIAATLRRAAADLSLIGRAGLDMSVPWFDLVNSTIAIALEAHERLYSNTERLAQLERLSLTDELTGLMNRRGIEERLRHELAWSQRHGEGGVLIFLDLDGFKPINDTFGHEAGDEVLRQVAGLLRGNVRESDSVGRIGGDEFVVLMPRSPRHTGMARAGDLEHLINHAYATWNGVMIAMRASCGTQFFEPEDDWKQVLRQADADMYRKKQAGRGTLAANDTGHHGAAIFGVGQGAVAQGAVAQGAVAQGAVAQGAVA